MMSSSKTDLHSTQSFVEAPNKTATVGAVTYGYREAGQRMGIPLLLLNHWGAGLDDFDPDIIDGLAAQHHVIAVDYKGVGLSSGRAPVTIEEMAQDIGEFIHAMGVERVDLLGFSLGGFVAQALARKAPGLIRTLILAGTGPAGGAGIDRLWSVSWPLMLKGALTLRDPRTYLFFTASPGSRQAARAFLKRLKRRSVNRDRGATPRALLRQLKAIKAWGRQSPQNLERFPMPVLIANGDSDIMVPSALSRDMARRIPNAQLVIYPDAGHGGVFQYHIEFVSTVLEFLAAQQAVSSENQRIHFT